MLGDTSDRDSAGDPGRRLRLPSPDRPEARPRRASPAPDAVGPDGGLPPEEGLENASTVTASDGRSIRRAPVRAPRDRREPGRGRETAPEPEPVGEAAQGVPRSRPVEPFAPPVRSRGAEEALPALSRPRSESIRSGVGHAGPGDGLAARVLEARASTASDPWPELPARAAMPSPPEPGARVVRDLARATRLHREQEAV